MSLVSLDTASDDLTAQAPGRPLRVALVAFYNYESHALRIFHPLLKQRGHDVHSIYFKNYFTYQVPTQLEEDMVVELVARIQPDVVAMSVWSTYYQLAGRLSRRIKEETGAVVIWGGIHPQTRPEDCLKHADVVCRSEGEYVLAELTDRIGLGLGYDDLRGCWVRSGDEIIRNPSRPLIPNIDVLPQPDFSPDNKYYLGREEWRDVARWDQHAVGYDIMAVRGCPFECTFCIHNFTRKATEGLGTYLRRRSVDHVLTELVTAKALRPRLQAVAFSDDIFGPPKPWLEEFCDRYKREVGLPWVMYSHPNMVDETKIRMMRDAGLFATTMGIQSGSERIRRDCYERDTPTKDIIRTCRLFARYGVVRNLDFIGDNPYEAIRDRLETIDLLARLPKPFYFNYFSLTYFPGVDLTERALRDGFIGPDQVEDVAQKGYHIWGGGLEEKRGDAELHWDVAYTMAARGLPGSLIRRLRTLPQYQQWIRPLARTMRQVNAVANRKNRMVDRLRKRPNLAWMFWANTNRDQAHPSGPNIQPNIGSSPLAAPIGAGNGARPFSPPAPPPGSPDVQSPAPG